MWPGLHYNNYGERAVQCMDGPECAHQHALSMHAWPKPEHGNGRPPISPHPTHPTPPHPQFLLDWAPELEDLKTFARGCRVDSAVSEAAALAVEEGVTAAAFCPSHCCRLWGPTQQQSTNAMLRKFWLLLSIRPSCLLQALDSLTETSLQMASDFVSPLCPA